MIKLKYHAKIICVQHSLEFYFKRPKFSISVSFIFLSIYIYIYLFHCKIVIAIEIINIYEIVNN